MQPKLIRSKRGQVHWHAHVAFKSKNCVIWSLDTREKRVDASFCSSDKRRLICELEVSPDSPQFKTRSQLPPSVVSIELDDAENWQGFADRVGRYTVLVGAFKRPKD